MRRLSAPDVVLKGLGLLLLTAAVLKGHELLTVPMANRDLWSWRPFLIFQVEFELGLGIWLLSGLLRPLAWLAALLCFGLFCGVTLYKGLTGAASCGCFGTIHVNPWVTLLIIDLPAVITLVLFRPCPVLAAGRLFLSDLPTLRTRGRESWRRVLTASTLPLPSLPRFAATAILGLASLGLTAPLLVLHEPAPVTLTYEVLDPETWVGQDWPILKYIDIAETLGTGQWLVMLYHHDCPDCAVAIPSYEQMARDLDGGEDFLRIALIEMPPYGAGPIDEEAPCTRGRLSDAKEWFVTTPAVTLLTDGRVISAWEAEAPDMETVLQNLALSSPPQAQLTPLYHARTGLDGRLVRHRP